MIFTELVQALLKVRGDPDDYLLHAYIQSLKREISTDLNRAFQLSENLVLHNKTLFYSSNCFLSFLFTLIEVPFHHDNSNTLKGQFELDECLTRDNNECQQCVEVLDKLQTCKEQCKKYEKFKEKLETCENELTQCSNQLKKCEKEFQTCTTERKHIKNKLETCTGEFEQMKADLKTCREEREQMEIKLKQCTEEREQMEAKLKDINLCHNDFFENMDSQESSASCRQNNDDFQAEMFQKTQELEKYKTLIIDLQDKINCIKKEAQAKIEIQDNELDTCQQTNINLNAQLNKCTDNLQLLNVRYTTCVQNLEDLRNQLTAQLKVDTPNNEQSLYKEIVDLKSSKADIERQLHEKELIINQRDVDLNKKQFIINQNEMKLRERKAIMDENEKQLKINYDTKLDEKDKEINQLNSHLEETQKMIEQNKQYINELIKEKELLKEKLSEQDKNRMKHISDLNINLDQNKEDIEKLIKENESLKLKLNEKNENLKKLNDDLNEKLKTQFEDIEQLTNENSNLKETLKINNDTYSRAINEKNKEIQCLTENESLNQDDFEKKLAEKNKLIQHLYDEVTGKDQSIETLNKQINEITETTQHLTADATHKDKIIEHLNSAIDLRDNTIVNLVTEEKDNLLKHYNSVLKILNIDSKMSQEEIETNLLNEVHKQKNANEYLEIIQDIFKFQAIPSQEAFKIELTSFSFYLNQIKAALHLKGESSITEILEKIQQNVKPMKQFKKTAQLQDTSHLETNISKKPEKRKSTRDSTFKKPRLFITGSVLKALITYLYKHYFELKYKIWSNEFISKELLNVISEKLTILEKMSATKTNTVIVDVLLDYVMTDLNIIKEDFHNDLEELKFEEDQEEEVQNLLVICMEKTENFLKNILQKESTHVKMDIGSTLDNQPLMESTISTSEMY